MSSVKNAFLNIFRYFINLGRGIKNQTAWKTLIFCFSVMHLRLAFGILFLTQLAFCQNRLRKVKNSLTPGRRCWPRWPFLTFKLDCERHRSDRDERFISKLSGNDCWRKQYLKIRLWTLKRLKTRFSDSRKPNLKSLFGCFEKKSSKGRAWPVTGAPGVARTGVAG